MAKKAKKKAKPEIVYENTHDLLIRLDHANTRVGTAVVALLLADGRAFTTLAPGTYRISAKVEHIA